MKNCKFHLLLAAVLLGGCSPSAGGSGDGDGGACRALGDPCTNLTGPNGCCTSICRNRGGSTNVCACLAFSEACVESVQCCEVRLGGTARPGRCLNGRCG